MFRVRTPGWYHSNHESKGNRQSCSLENICSAFFPKIINQQPLLSLPPCNDRSSVEAHDLLSPQQLASVGDTRPPKWLERELSVAAEHGEGILAALLHDPQRNVTKPGIPSTKSARPPFGIVFVDGASFAGPAEWARIRASPAVRKCSPRFVRYSIPQICSSKFDAYFFKSQSGPLGSIERYSCKNHSH